MFHELKRLLKRPGQLALGIAMLAIGLGTATALISVYRGVLLAPLPVANAERLVDVAWRYQAWRVGFDDRQFHAYRSAQTQFSAFAAQTRASYTLASTDGSRRIAALHVSGDFFAAIGTSPRLGRPLTGDDDRRGAALVAVVDAALARQRFGNEQAALDQSVALDGQSYRIVGVVDRELAQFHGVDVYLPLAPVAQTIGQGSNYQVLARLADSATLTSAAAEFEALAPSVFAGRNGPPAPALMALADAYTESARTPMLMLGAGVVLLLLVALANFANLLMLRAAERRAELALRSALGASVSRLRRAIQIESVAIAIAGASVGWWLAAALVRTLAALSEMPRVESVALDGFAFLAASALALGFGLTASLPAAWQASRRSAAEALRSGSSGQLQAPSRLGASLVAAQVAMCVVIGVAALLLVRTVDSLRAVDPGFRTQGLLAAQWWSSGSGLADSRSVAAYAERLVERVEALPGISRAGVVVGGLPLQQGGNVAVEVPSFSDDIQSVDFRAVGGGYFESLGLNPIEGRLIGRSDGADDEPVVVVNRAFVQAYLDGRPAIGSSLKAADRDWRIVGVVADVRSSLQEPAPPTLFLPIAQTPVDTLQIFESWFPSQLLVRTSGEASAQAVTLGRAAAAVDANVPVGSVQTMDDIHAQAMQAQRLYMLLMSLFASAALLMAIGGIYSLLSRRMAAATRDLGVALALGAPRLSLVTRATLRGLAPVMMGLAIGIAAAIGLARFIESMLFGVDALAPSVYALVALCMALAALLSALAPALRATRISPAIALRAN